MDSEGLGEGHTVQDPGTKVSVGLGRAGLWKPRPPGFNPWPTCAAVRPVTPSFQRVLDIIHHWVV